MSWRSWLDASPVATMALLAMREATGRERPLEPLRPIRPRGLAPGARVGFWSLRGGVGASTLAALVAHRSAAASRPALLVDLDRWAPSLALRAEVSAATITDALLHPGRERDFVSRWAGAPFLPGSPQLHGAFDGQRIASLVETLAAAGPAVLDLGAGPDALDSAVATILTHLVVVTGTRVAQLQAAFCATVCVRELPCPIGLAVVGAAEDDASAVAARLPWPLLGAIPADPYLAEDAFAARAPTLRAIDALIEALP